MVLGDRFWLKNNRQFLAILKMCDVEGDGGDSNLRPSGYEG